MEAQVEELIGEPGVFVFPEPPLPVAGYGNKPKPAPAKKPAASKDNEAVTEDVPEENSETESAE